MPTLWKYDDMLRAVEINVETNISFDKIKSIQKNYGDARNHVEQTLIEDSGRKLTVFGSISFLMWSW